MASRVRQTARLVALALWLVLLLPLHAVVVAVGRPSPFPRRFLRGAAAIVGMRVKVDGTPVRGPVLYVANHVSWIDILVLGGRTGAAFVTKADMDGWPLFGLLARINGSIYVARERRLSADAQANTLRAALERPRPVALFPEGTTNDGTALLPFRSSLFASVAPPPPGVAIQPVAIDYGADAPALAWVGEESIGHNGLRVLARRRATVVTLRFLPPLAPADLPHRKLIARHASDAIAAALGLQNVRMIPEKSDAPASAA